MVRWFLRLGGLLLAAWVLVLGAVLLLIDRSVPIPLYVEQAIDASRTRTIVYAEMPQTGERMTLHHVEGWRRTSISQDRPQAVMWDTTGNSSDVWLVNLSTGREQLVAEDMFVRFQADATWSRDGRHFAFVVMHSGYFKDGVMRIDTRTGEAAHVTDWQTSSFFPVLSAQGEQMLYVTMANGRYEIYRQQAEVTEKITNAELNGFNPSLSPDGTRMVYTSRRDHHDELYLMDLQTGTEQHIMADPSAVLGAAAVWSPDGRYVAYAARPDSISPRRVHLIDMEAHTVIPLVDAPSGDSSHLRWTANGEWLAFRADIDNTGMKAHIIHVESREIIPLRDNPTAGLSFAGFAEW